MVNSHYTQKYTSTRTYTLTYMYSHILVYLHIYTCIYLSQCTSRPASKRFHLPSPTIFVIYFIDYKQTLKPKNGTIVQRPKKIPESYS